MASGEGKTLLIRADSSEKVGAGHVMRCLALAQRWRSNGGRVIFAACSLLEPFRRRLQLEGMEVAMLDAAPGSREDSVGTRNLAAAKHTFCIVADLFERTESYLESLQSSSWKSLCLDDNAELPSYPVDFVLNPNGHAHPEQYRAKTGARLLLGPKYALLRKEFLAYRDPAPAFAGGKKLLITFGGGDQILLLAQLVRQLAPVLHPFHLSFILSRADFDLHPLESTLAEYQLTSQCLISPPDMAGELAKHDLLISSGGSTVWESLFMGIPACFIAITPNQKPSCLQLSRTLPHPVFTSLDEVNSGTLASFFHDREFQSSLTQAGRKVVDGFGGERVIEMLLA